MELVFPFDEYWAFYLGFSGFILAMLALDLGVLGKHSREPGLKAALTWSAIWIGLAFVFNVLVYVYAHWKIGGNPDLAALHGEPGAVSSRLGLEFLTGYLVEKALAVDNIFVFLLVFSAFGIPKAYQHRVLFFGIIGALVFRILFIAMGSMLMRFHWLVVGFGIFLVLTGVKTILSREKPVDPGNSPALMLLKRFMPITDELHGSRFFVRHQGALYATPLFACLVILEISDIVFAVDSVPAIFAITKEPFLVFTSNIFAILGLRSMYFLLAGVVGKLRYLKHGLGAVLVFVGLKMAWLNSLFGGKFPVGVSLGIIALILGTSIVASLLRQKSVEGTERPPHG